MHARGRGPSIGPRLDGSHGRSNTQRLEHQVELLTMRLRKVPSARKAASNRGKGIELVGNSAGPVSRRQRLKTVIKCLERVVANACHRFLVLSCNQVVPS